MLRLSGGPYLGQICGRCSQPELWTLPASSQDGHVCEAHSTTRNPVTPEAALGRQGSSNPWEKESDQRAATCQL